jgi:hypothetical protein
LIRAKAGVCGPTPGVASDSNKRRRSFRVPTISTSAPICEQYRAIGWVGQRLYSVIFEIREDAEGEFYHLVTLWRSTREEQQLYEEHS